MRFFLLCGALALAFVAMCCEVYGLPVTADDLGGDHLPPASHFHRVKTPEHIINLDLAPEHRWDSVAAAYRSSAPAVVKYFTGMVPLSKRELELLEWVAAHLDTHLGDLGKEMKGIAEKLGIDLGIIVALNFSYELRRLGGPTPNTTIPDASSPSAPEPLWCSSIVAPTPEGRIVHGRNLDWNLPNNLKNLTFTGHFQKGGKTVYSGTVFAGFVGMLTGVKKGGFSISANARETGGNPLVDALAALRKGAWSPTHLVRHVLETATSYEEAVAALQAGHLTAPIYWIMGGLSADQGVVVSRNRESVADNWHLQQPTQWYLYESNYDHWTQPPAGDDRRKYGLAAMNKLTAARVSEAGLLSVLEVWPVRNNDTTYTAIFSATTGELASYIQYLEE